MPSRPLSCMDWAADCHHRKLPTSRIAWERWSPAAAGQSRIGRFLKRTRFEQESDGWRQHELELGFAARHGCGRIGRTVIWFRYSRHFGHHGRSVTGLRFVFEELGNHGFHCHLGHGSGGNAGGFSRRALWPARQLARTGAFLLDLSFRVRICLELVVSGRVSLIGGLGIGGSSVLGPMYIAEIAPAKWRGRLVGFFQFNVVSGILLAYFSNYLICR